MFSYDIKPVKGKGDWRHSMRICDLEVLHVNVDSLNVERSHKDDLKSTVQGGFYAACQSYD